MKFWAEIKSEISRYMPTWTILLVWDFFVFCFEILEKP